MSGDVQEVLFRVYEKSLGKEVLTVKKEERRPAQEGQVRMIFFTPPEFALVLRKDENLSVIVPLTSYIPLAITDRYPPLIKWRGFRLVPLPFWVYASNRLLEKHSVPMFRIRELEEIRKYVKEARTKGIGTWRERFVKKVAERYKDLNLSSLIFEAIREDGNGMARGDLP